MSTGGSPSRKLFGRNRRRKKLSQDDMDLNRAKSAGPLRLFKMSRDDSGLGRRTSDNNASPSFQKHYSDDEYSSADSSTYRKASRLARFRRNLMRRKPARGHMPRMDESSHNGGGESRALARIQSFDSDESDPPINPNTFDDEPPQLRSILKKAVSSPRTSPRKKAQLIVDPTHMPYNPGVQFGQPTTDQDDSQDGNASYEDLYGQEPPRERRRGQRARYSVYQGNSTVKRKFRVRPYRCFPDGRTMTEEEIYADSLKPSQDFIFLNSYLASTSKNLRKMKVPPEVASLFGTPNDDGRIGALRMEVLGCVSLARTKPDISVYAVCGDVAFCTDVLSGYRSPMWPSASRRAAVFPVHHAFATMFVGVFDVKVRSNKDNDTFCGRVAIDIASLRADTEYDVTFPLRASSFAYDRRKRGVMRLRFSLHWFSERAAVVSYFKKAKSVAKSAPFFEGHPTIPCADPKTFRNVAVTVYGQDLPGKYTKNAFRATMREWNLYQQNMSLMVKAAALDAILYERLHISLYLFVAGLYCVWAESVRMVPPMCVGYMLLLFLENYHYYVESNKFNLGYQPLTLPEVAKGLLCQPNPKGAWFEPLLVEKKTKRKRAGYGIPGEVADEENELEIQPLDHREFPFSDRDAYPKLSVEDSLAPGKKEKGGNSRLHGRLSVYYTAAPPTENDDADDADDDDDSENIDEGDDDTIMGGQDAMFGLDLEDGDLDEEEQEQEGVPFAHQSQSGMIQSHGSTRRIKLGPPQNVDVRGRKNPPQVQLQKVEKMLHQRSFKVSVELVHPPATESGASAPTGSGEFSGGLSNELTKALQESAMNVKKKKAIYDEFDRLLGLQTRTANPVMRILSSFLGPLQRMLRVFIFIFRISFHISTWKDPFLSFWCFVVLSSVCLILIIFPWRSFFLIAITVSLGPQNIFVRKYLERRAVEKAMEDTDEDETESSSGGQKGISQSLTQPSETSALNSQHSNHDRRKWPFVSSGKTKRSTNLPSHGSIEGLPNFLGESDRPAFRPEHHVQATSSRKNPRAVAIPYSRLKKDRFFDWPPDPTVSRATPMEFRGAPKSTPRSVPEKSKVLNRLEPAELAEATGNITQVSKELPRGLRRRAQHRSEHEVPRNLYI